MLLEEASEGSLGVIRGTLRDLGLTGYAADAFGALARMPAGSAADLVRATGIPDSKIYYALDELVEKGLAEVQNGKPKTYRVVPAKEIQARLAQLLEHRHEAERSAMSRMVSVLEPIRAAAKSPTSDLAYIVKGDSNVLARARSMIASARKEVVLLASDEDFLRKLEPPLLGALGRRVGVRLAVPDIELPKDLEKRAEIRSIVCSCVLLVVDRQQVLTVSRHPDGLSYGITSTDALLVRLGLEYWESPRCCVS